MNKTFISLWKNNKSFILFLVLMFTFRSALADWNTVPSGSMKPTILEGDRIFVNKAAYNIRIPFTHISLFQLSDPQRGDIVVFDSKVSDKRLVKRVIGIPRDTVEMQDNVLYINGKKLAYSNISNSGTGQEKIEYLGDIAHRIQINALGSSASSFSTIKIPEDLYLMLGDNRDNSADSRFIGLVPRHEIVGRTKSVVLSLNYDNYFIPRGDRIFHTL